MNTPAFPPEPPVLVAFTDRRATNSDGAGPVVYGDPARVDALLQSVARLMALEPVEVWADAGVKRSVRQLSALATRRMDEATRPQPGRRALRVRDRWVGP